MIVIISAVLSIKYLEKNVAHIYQFSNGMRTYSNYTKCDATKSALQATPKLLN